LSYSRAIESVERYYAEKLEQHGPTPPGVDWNGDRSQTLRFEQLLEIVGEAGDFSINDYGCGYGALVDHLVRRGRDFRYTGYDISRAMVAEARRRYADEERARFVSGLPEVGPADFTIASGVFNVKLDTPEEDWRRYVLEMIGEIAGLSNRGMAFNALTSHTDPGRRRPDLYYCDPAELLDHCLRTYSRDVYLAHDYELYEFTVAVRLDGRTPAAQPARLT
jgi:SAM-dependent methyltransferase